MARNDDALRDAVVEMVAEVGWDAVTFTGVASRAGLTVGAVYGRAETQAELGIDLWEARVREWFTATMSQMLQAGQVGDAAGVGRALQRWHDEPAMTAVVVDLLIGPLFDPDLEEVVGVQARQILGPACTPSIQPRLPAQLAAAGALLMSFGLGHAIALRGGAVPDALNRQQSQSFAGVAGSSAVPCSSPTS